VFTCHPTQVNAARLTPVMQAGTRFTYPGGMEGWVDIIYKPTVNSTSFYGGEQQTAWHCG